MNSRSLRTRQIGSIKYDRQFPGFSWKKFRLWYSCRNPTSRLASFTLETIMNNKTTIKVKKIRRKAALVLKRFFLWDKVKSKKFSLHLSLTSSMIVERNIYVNFMEFNGHRLEKIRFKRDISGNTIQNLWYYFNLDQSLQSVQAVFLVTEVWHVPAALEEELIYLTTSFMKMTGSFQLVARHRNLETWIIRK